jgi:hypothetical protein
MDAKLAAIKVDPNPQADENQQHETKPQPGEKSIDGPCDQG